MRFGLVNIFKQIKYGICVRPFLLCFSFGKLENLLQAQASYQEPNEYRKEYNESKEKTALGLNSAIYIHIKRSQPNENQINFPFSVGFWFV